MPCVTGTIWWRQRESDRVRRVKGVKIAELEPERPSGGLKDAPASLRPVLGAVLAGAHSRHDASELLSMALDWLPGR